MTKQNPDHLPDVGNMVDHTEDNLDMAQSPIREAVDALEFTSFLHTFAEPSARQLGKTHALEQIQKAQKAHANLTKFAPLIENAIKEHLENHKFRGYIDGSSFDEAEALIKAGWPVEKPQ